MISVVNKGKNVPNSTKLYPFDFNCQDIFKTIFIKLLISCLMNMQKILAPLRELTEI